MALTKEELGKVNEKIDGLHKELAGLKEFVNTQFADTEEKPAEEKPAEEKPVEEKPAEKTKA